MNTTEVVAGALVGFFPGGVLAVWGYRAYRQMRTALEETMPLMEAATNTMNAADAAVIRLQGELDQAKKDRTAAFLREESAKGILFGIMDERDVWKDLFHATREASSNAQAMMWDEIDVMAQLLGRKVTPQIQQAMAAADKARAATEPLLLRRDEAKALVEEAAGGEKADVRPEAREALAAFDDARYAKAGLLSPRAEAAAEARATAAAERTKPERPA